MTRGTVLLVDDDQAIEALVKASLEKESFHVRVVRSVSEAKKQIDKIAPDLIILDRMLPDGDGIEVCNFLRNQSGTGSVPVLFLSAKQAVAEKVASLKVGGDDYLPKPFDNQELVARVEALLRRMEKPVGPQQVVNVGDLRLDPSTHECLLAGKPIDLRPKEFELLQLFLQSKKRVLTKEFLSERVWDAPFLTSSRAIDTAVQRLRDKLGPYSDSIETVRGYGFRFNEQKLQSPKKSKKPRTA